jgi:hypothetical protein
MHLMGPLSLLGVLIRGAACLAGANAEGAAEEMGLECGPLFARTTRDELEDMENGDGVVDSEAVGEGL